MEFIIVQTMHLFVNHIINYLCSIVHVQSYCSCLEDLNNNIHGNRPTVPLKDNIVLIWLYLNLDYLLLFSQQGLSQNLQVSRRSVKA